MKGRGRSIRTDGYHSSRHHEPEVPTVDLHKLRYHIGVQRLANGNKVAYDAAILGGLNDEAPDLTVRFNLEFEMY